jgi:pimeloyl-ACP methyl ester carboxylesterase
MWPSSYAHLIDEARARLARIEHHSVQTQFGAIEYAERGSGPPLLLLHVVFGGYDSVEHAAVSWIGDGFRIIGPSRFGYLGSSLPRDATAAMQADAYAALLDQLGIERAPIVGFSAGTVSAIQFSLRHPDRTVALVLMSGHHPQKHYAIPAWSLRLAYRDRVFWAAKTFTPTLFDAIYGIPKGFGPSPAERSALEAIESSLFPIGPRREGAIFDTLVSEPDVDNFPLEQMTVPTLMIHATDDCLARYRTAPPAAARIPGAQLVTIERGGHLHLGAEARAREAVLGFIAEHLENQRSVLRAEDVVTSGVLETLVPPRGGRETAGS